MKVSPVAAGSTNAINPNEGIAAGPDRLAKAKAIAAGQELPPLEASKSSDPQVDRIQNSMKRLKMKTQVSQNRHETVEPAPLEVAPEVTDSDKVDSIEQAPVVSEETKPLSPQFAALAKLKREIQLERKELEAQKAALGTSSEGTKSLEEYRARIKANALSVLQEEGVTYDQLTEQILASNQESADFAALKAKVKALEEGLDTRLSERDQQAEQQVLAQIRKEAEQLVSQGDDFEMIREAGYAPKVVELIHKTFKTTGEYLDVSEAASLVEQTLLEDSLKWAKIKKVQSRLNPAAPKQQPPVQQDRPGTKVMRTLTNRDGSTSNVMGKRERAIAAMEGRLK